MNELHNSLVINLTLIYGGFHHEIAPTALQGITGPVSDQLFSYTTCCFDKYQRKTSLVLKLQ